MQKKPTPIDEITKKVIKNISKDRRAKQERIKKVWQKAVGKKFHPHTLPVSFRKKRLIVSVDSSPWLYELTMRRQKITAKLKKALKEEFKEVQFRIGTIER